MKLLTAIIRPEKLDDALAAIAESASVRLATARSGSAAWRVCCGSGPVSGTTTHPRHHATGTLTSSRSGWSCAPCRASSSKWAGHCGPASPAPAARRYPRPGRPGHSRPGRVIMSHIRVRRSTLGLFMFSRLRSRCTCLCPGPAVQAPARQDNRPASHHARRLRRHDSRPPRPRPRGPAPRHRPPSPTPPATTPGPTPTPEPSTQSHEHWPPPTRATPGRGPRAGSRLARETTESHLPERPSQYLANLGSMPGNLYNAWPWLDVDPHSSLRGPVAKAI